VAVAECRRLVASAAIGCVLRKLVLGHEYPAAAEVRILPARYLWMIFLLMIAVAAPELKVVQLCQRGALFRFGRVTEIRQAAMSREAVSTRRSASLHCATCRPSCTLASTRTTTGHTAWCPTDRRTR
jgi:hypothetical protein